jgi:hypothetical protein
MHMSKLLRRTLYLGLGFLATSVGAAASARESCAAPSVERISEFARAATKQVAKRTPVPLAGAIAGAAYDRSQCVAVKQGAKLREWARKKRQGEQE